MLVSFFLLFFFCGVAYDVFRHQNTEANIMGELEPILSDFGT